MKLRILTNGIVQGLDKIDQYDRDESMYMLKLSNEKQRTSKSLLINTINK
jgi:hypothetical protein